MVEFLFFARNAILQRHATYISGLNRLHALYCLYCSTLRSAVLQYGLMYHLYHNTVYTLCTWSYFEPNPYAILRFWKWQQLLLIFSSTGMLCLPATSFSASEKNLTCQLHKLQEELVRDAKEPAKVSGLSGVVAFQLCLPEYFRPQSLGEIRSWVDFQSALDAGTIAILGLLHIRRPHVLYYSTSTPRAHSVKVLARHRFL